MYILLVPKFRLGNAVLKLQRGKGAIAVLRVLRRMGKKEKSESHATPAYYPVAAAQPNAQSDAGLRFASFPRSPLAVIHKCWSTVISAWMPKSSVQGWQTVGNICPFIQGRETKAW
ncbi:MAG: hypothetical protein DM484_06975 [Candidatus Methylumidiphilus alinenensis]|uniref:Uncharacterized protein n=1 Tax=Candidatus Methylumidiphilus alinenensis TaxID=2202197 RepID=A0A2W4TC27_9GAMM|nr:MAG: hypothetical protein DM484_06975 [Candidatus Methylumidiphilus alinenensis]